MVLAINLGQSSGSGSTNPVVTLIVLIIVGIAALYLWKKYGSGMAAPAAEEPPPADGNGDGAATGESVYQVVGPISPTDGTRVSEASNNSQRDNQGYDCSICNREATWIFNSGGGDDVSIKMGSHGDEGDETSLIEFTTDGQRWRCEGPHMTYSDLDGGSGNLDLGSTQVGVKGISWTTGSNASHHEIWFNADGSGSGWTKAAEWEGQASGCNEMTCPVPGGSCQDTLRMDDPPSGWEFISRSIVEIVPGQLASGGTSTPPPTTTPPPPATNGEDEEEEEQDGEDEDGEADLARVLIAKRYRNHNRYRNFNCQTIKLGNYY